MSSRFCPSAILSASLMLGSLPACGGEAQFGPAPQVLFERNIEDNVRRRYEIRTTYVGLPDGVSSKEILEKVKDLVVNEEVLRVELVSDPKRSKGPLLKTTFLGHLKEQIARESEWRTHALRNLSVGKDFAGFTFEISLTSAEAPSLGCDDPGSIGFLSERFRGAASEAVDVDIYEAFNGTISVHNFLRMVIREDCNLERTPNGWIIRSRHKLGKTTEGGKGNRLSWLSGKTRAIYITSVGGKPDGLLPLYVLKFPSAIPDEFKIDKGAWGREEMEFWLPKMQVATRSGDSGAASPHFSPAAGEKCGNHQTTSTKRQTSPKLQSSMVQAETTWCCPRPWGLALVIEHSGLGDCLVLGVWLLGFPAFREKCGLD